MTLDTTFCINRLAARPLQDTAWRKSAVTQFIQLLFSGLKARRKFPQEEIELRLSELSQSEGMAAFTGNKNVTV